MKELTIEQLVDFLDDQIERCGKFMKREWIPYFEKLKEIVNCETRLIDGIGLRATVIVDEALISQLSKIKEGMK